MNEHCRYAFEVSLGNRFDEVVIHHSAEAFVVDNHVVLLRPAWLAVNRNLVVAARAAFVNDVEINVDSLRQALFDDQFLVVVIVTAAACNNQSL